MDDRGLDQAQTQYDRQEPPAVMMDTQDKPVVPQYIGIGPENGKIVSATNAYDYAKQHLDDISESDKKDFVEWFYSGNWISSEDVFLLKRGEHQWTN